MQIEHLHEYEFIGELSLSGQLRNIHGVLPAAVASAKNARTIVLPIENGSKALLAKHSPVLASNSLLEICTHLSEQEVPRVPKEQLRQQSSTRTESSMDIRNRVVETRQWQLNRQQKPNVFMNNKEIGHHCVLNNECE